MSDIETNEVELDDVDTDEMDGSFLATAAVIGAGALLGFAVAKGYDKAKDAIQTKLTERRARKILAQMDAMDNAADEVE